MKVLFGESDSLEKKTFIELTGDTQNSVRKKTTWSMEILPQNISEVSLIPEFVNEVYITMIPGVDCRDTIEAANVIQTKGKQAIPHIAARSFSSPEVLKKCLSRLQDAGIKKVLLIGGGVPEPTGKYASVMDLLKTGLFAEYGINSFDFAGHPEGNPDDPKSEYHMLEKLQWTKEHEFSSRFVTQWSLDAKKPNNWISDLREKGVSNPIHIGVPGPSTVKSLMRFAKVCGVKASTQVLRKQGLNISKLMFVNKPDKIISKLSGYDQLHLYPFGGIAKSAAWLIDFQSINN
ncbi:MAG: methylenetetrahydrofolate reductase [SAR324 cluster bacterium]|nr:methylenetetrahydrofolate reductase [SAR324 cluster bacterium]